MTPPNSPAFLRDGEIAREWWGRYIGPDASETATRARLRRCRSVQEALSIIPAVHLARRLGGMRSDRDVSARLEAALGLAIVLASVRQDDPENRLMRSVGWSSFPEDGKKEKLDQPLLSELRFKRLLLSRQDELIPVFSRLVKLMGGRANVADVAAGFLDWSHPWRGDRVRQRWAFDYYAAGAAAPSESSSTETSAQ
jgi:CRISPR system Cascade subunit CasB